MRLRVATLVAAASLAAAAPAAADTYTVIGSGDNSIPAGCAPTGSGTWTCNHLRGAVNEANANGMADTIVIAVPTVTLSVDAIPINSELNVIGTSARQTIIDATGAQAPAFEVGGGATASFTNLTIRRGTGGNVVVVSGTANFAFTRVTGSLSGAGIVNEGTANVTFSLLDANAGGGIDNVGGSQPANLLVGSTTVANNAGFGIRSRLNAANTVDLLRATVARNSGVGMSFDATQDTSVNASIIANNVGNCAGGILAASFSVEDTNSCGMSPADSNRVNADPLLAATLSDQGGQTDVLTIPANSPAADLLVPLVCSSGFDQRFFAVPAGQPCDAGAYDREATDPGFTQPPPPPQPPPTPTPQPTPTPVVNQTVVAAEIKGTVKVQLKGTKTFVDLDATRGIPMGSTIDTRKGRVELTSVPKAGAPPEKAQFYDGLFKVTQSKGITILTLTEVLDCSKGKRASASPEEAQEAQALGRRQGRVPDRGASTARRPCAARGGSSRTRARRPRPP